MMAGADKDGDFRFVKWLLPAVVFISNTAAAEVCVTYETMTTLRGKLSRQTFPEEPNYESVAKGDRPASYFFISPGRPLCISKGRDDSEPAERGIKEDIQLQFEGSKTFNRLRPYLGNTVECRGTFYHAISGHHHSTLLLGSAECHPYRRD